MRSVVLGFRVTPAERHTLERAADREALPVRAWARRLLLLAANSDTGRIGGVKTRTRLDHWRSILWGPLLKILGVAYTILGLASFIRGEFLPTRGGPLIGFIPTWPFTTWLMIGLGLVLVVVLEGSYRVVSGVERNAGLEVEELADCEPRACSSTLHSKGRHCPRKLDCGTPGMGETAVSVVGFEVWPNDQKSTGISRCTYRQVLFARLRLKPQSRTTDSE
jgi:hypothetical protein